MVLLTFIFSKNLSVCGGMVSTDKDKNEIMRMKSVCDFHTQKNKGSKLEKLGFFADRIEKKT